MEICVQTRISISVVIGSPVGSLTWVRTYSLTVRIKLYSVYWTNSLHYIIMRETVSLCGKGNLSNDLSDDPGNDPCKKFTYVPVYKKDKSLWKERPKW